MLKLTLLRRTMVVTIPTHVVFVHSEVEPHSSITQCFYSQQSLNRDFVR